MTDDDVEDRYTIRWFDPADSEAFLALHGQALSGASDQWFEWKYLDNPFVSHVPILVAESKSGAFAGARPQVPIRMRAGDETFLGLRFGDTMVHPDHRRRGVFSTLTRRALDHYRRMPPRLCFNCPNDLSRPGFLDVGGRQITELRSYYRVQRPAAFLGNGVGGLAAATVGQLAARGYLATRRARARSPDDVRVVRHDGIPIELLTALYERHVPSEVHAVRDRTFLDWRYRNPAWEYAVHSATIAGRPVAAMVTGRGTQGETRVATIVDVVPLEGDRRRNRGLRALLEAVLPRYVDADVIAYSGRVLPRPMLRAFGFLADGSLPLSAVANPSTLVAYDLSSDGEPPWAPGGIDARDPAAWTLTYAELDAH